MQLREMKALELAARKKIIQKNGQWLVPSQSGNGEYYVSLFPPKCDCQDFVVRGEACKHILAARFVKERDGGDKQPALDTNKVPKRPTYRQNWPEYNEAQATEKHRFKELLRDLCGGITEPPSPKTGRKPTPMKDGIFSVVYKVYSGVSTRRFNCDLQDAFKDGYLSQKLHYNRVPQFMEDDNLTPYLQELIVRSSLPLREIEEHFSPDSSGFSSSQFTRWYDEKYGVEKQQHTWVKCHLMCGVKTGIVTAAEIHDKNAGDSPQFPSLLGTTAENFDVKEVSADMGYISKANLEAAVNIGAMPYIPFKSDHRAGLGNDLWAKMFHYFSYHRQEFLEHYGKRSNVESVFSSIKRKFGEAVRAKTDTAMHNEAYAKILCHNVCAVIRSHIELKIETEFWPEEKEDKDILRMPVGG